MGFEDNLRIAQLTKDVELLESQVKKLTQELNKLQIDNHSYITTNPSITPGIYPKIAFDSNGLVLKGLSLDPSDIPEISITQVSGLKSILDNIASAADIKKVSADIKSSIIKRSNESIGTATKVNYDANGFVVSGSSLTPDDIPNLPMEKVEGLIDIIDIIKSVTDSASNIQSTRNIDNITKSGTYTKVSVDSTGRVTGGDRLSINDLPVDLINRLNDIELSVVNAAPLELVDRLSKSMLNKIDSVSSVRPSTYTKVTVDSNGLVTKGANLTIDDLPELTIDSISGLKSELNRMAKYSDIADLNDSVSRIISNMQSISDINQIKSSLNQKAEADALSRLEKEFRVVRDNVAQIEESIPSEFILSKLNDIDQKLTTIEGRLYVLENRSSDN